MPDFTGDSEHFLSLTPRDSWPAAIAAALFVFLIAGVLPHLTW